MPSNNVNDGEYALIFTTAPGLGINRYETLLTVAHDGTITRGPAFTTLDDMSLQFWDAVEKHARRKPRGSSDA